LLVFCSQIAAIQTSTGLPNFKINLIGLFILKYNPPHSYTTERNVIIIIVIIIVKFSDIDVSQGNVTTHFRRGGIFNNRLVANCP